MDSIYPIFEETAIQFSTKPCLTFLGNRYSYSQVQSLIERAAGSLQDLGIARGDRAIVYLPNIPQWIVAWLALERIGAVAVPITPFYAPADLQYIADDSGAQTIFCLDTNFGYVVRVLSQTQLKRVIVTTMVEFLPLWKRLLGKLLNRVPEGAVRLSDDTLTFRQLLDRVPHGNAGARREPPGASLASRYASPLPGPRPTGARVQALPPSQGMETAEILYTGGTTGHPKGVPISHALFLESLREQRKARETLVPVGEDIILQGAPLYHILGQAVGLGGLLHGDHVILLPRTNLDALFDHIRRYQAKSFFGVPTLYRMILEHDRLDHYDLSSLRYCFSGGDVLPVEVARRWQRKFGQPIYQGYGATETCGGVALTPAGEPFPEGTSGKIVPFQRVRLVDPDTGDAVPEGKPGELLVASDHMVTGYWNKPGETARFFVQRDGKLWYRTGDIVQMTDGWLFFSDRSVDTIKHKGYRVAASRIETVLQEHPAVIASCVVGIPDQNVGERIKAFVVLKEDVKGVTAYDLMAWCRERLAPYEVPKYVEFRDMLPKSKVGKLLRRELRAEERRKTAT